jgi:hypothetical protein
MTHYVSGRDLKHLVPLIETAAYVRDPYSAFHYLHYVDGKSCLSGPRLRMTLGGHERDEAYRDELSKKIEWIGRSRRTKDGAYWNANFSKIDLDILKPTLTEEEKGQAVELLSGMVAELREMHATLSRPVAVEGRLKRRLDAYQAQNTKTEFIPELDAKLYVAGSLLEELDGFTAMKLHEWCKSDVRDAMVYKSVTIESLNYMANMLEHVQHSLERPEGAPFPNIPKEKRPQFRDFLGLSGIYGTQGIAFFLEQAAADSKIDWLDTQNKQEMHQKMERMSQDLKEHAELLGKALHCHVYAQTLHDLQPEKARQRWG